MASSGIGVTPGGFRDLPRAQRFLLPELLVAAAILAAGFAGILPFSATPVLVTFGVISLRLRGQGPRAVGLAFRSDWRHTVSVGIGAGIVYQGFSLYIAEPAIARLTGKLPDVSLFAPLAGNIHFLLISLTVAWTLAAFGEEFVYRACARGRAPRLARRTRGHKHCLRRGSPISGALRHDYRGVGWFRVRALVLGHRSQSLGVRHCTRHDGHGRVSPALSREIPRRMTPELVTFFQTGNPMALALAKGALESAGIPFVSEGEGLQDLIGLGRFPGGFNVATGPVKIQVDVRDAEAAKEVLADIENP